MLRMWPNAAASSRYFVPSGCATIVSATNPRNDGSAKGFGASEIQQIRQGCSRRVRWRRVTVKPQPRLASELGDDGAGERGRILGRPQLDERDECRFAHLDAVGPRFAAHVVHRENQEGVVRGLRHTVPDGEDRSRAARDVRLLLHFALDGSHDRLARLDVPGRNRPETFRETIRLADDEERVLADEERAYADGDRQRRDIHGHGILESVRRDGFIHRSLPEPRWTDGEEGHVHAAAIPSENLAIGELRRVPGRPPARLRREQGQAVVRLRAGPPDETDENPVALRAVRRSAGILAGR